MHPPRYHADNIGFDRRGQKHLVRELFSCCLSDDAQWSDREGIGLPIIWILECSFRVHLESVKIIVCFGEAPSLIDSCLSSRPVARRCRAVRSIVDVFSVAELLEGRVQNISSVCKREV